MDTETLVRVLVVENGALSSSLSRVKDATRGVHVRKRFARRTGGG